MNYQYNERKYAEKIMNEGFLTRFIKYELVVLAKYLQELDYSKKQTEEFLYKFCEKHIEGYNEVKYYSVIDNAIRDGRKKNNKLIVVEDLPVLKRELEYIDNLDLDDDYKKLLLSFLVKRKIAYEINRLFNGNNVELSAYFNGNKKSFREVFKNSNIKTKGSKVDEMIASLVKLGIIQSIVKGDIVLSYMYDIYDVETEFIEIPNKQTKQNERVEKKHIKYNINEDDVFYRLSDFENIGYLFDFYKGNNKIKICEGDGCGKFIRVTSNRVKYCKVCWKEKEKEDGRRYARESMRKIRENSKC